VKWIEEEAEPAIRDSALFFKERRIYVINKFLKGR
jgi:hypothetical protein